MQTRPVVDELRSELRGASLLSGLPANGRVRVALRSFWDRFGSPPATVEPYVEGTTRLGPLLWKPAVWGFCAVSAIVAGASQPTSPFTLTRIPGSWYFGIPPRSLVPGVTTPPGQNLFVGLVLVYAGMALMMRAWFDVYKVTTAHPGIPVRKLAPVFVLWVLPLLVVAPLFSRDVYSYAAQGEMMSHGINPYSYGPSVLGVNSWMAPVDPLWQDVTSPYGPLFLGAAGSIVSWTGHNELASVVGLRLLALAGVVLIAVFLPRLARSYGYDSGTAFTIAVLNPLVLLHLVGGAHNDALMLGLLVAGLSLARSGRRVVGTVVVALAASVKIPAALGILYIGWEWLGDEAPWRERVRPMVSTLLIGGVVLAGVTQVVGLGWGWVAALANPDTVRSYLDPATAIGLVAGHLLHAAGLPDHTGGVLSVARGFAFLLAIAIGVRLLLRSTRATSGRAIGMTLLVVTVLGPVLQPWYLAWAIVFLAAVAGPRLRTGLIVLSCCSSFLGLPGAFTLLDELTAANPLLVAVATVVLVGIAALIAGPAVRRAALGARRGRRRAQNVPVEAMLDL